VQIANKPLGFYAWYMLAVLALVYALSLIDRQILSILAEDVRRDLSLTDVQLGYLYGTAFAMFYAIFGIPLGRLADNWKRTYLLAAGLALWSLMTGLSGLASSFALLAAARIGVGIGEASASPSAYSMIASTFPVHRRGLAIAIYSAGSYLGTGLSLPLGAWLAHTWNQTYEVGSAPLGLYGWQAAFIGVGIPGLLLALFVISMREPPRFNADGGLIPVVRPGVWRMFFTDLMAILPPFTLLVAARETSSLRRNVVAAISIGMIAAILIYLTDDVGQWVTYALGVYAIVSWAQSLRHTDAPAHRLFWGGPTVPWCVMGIGLAGVVFNTVLLWASPYAIRTFGVSATEIGPLIGIPGAIASALGCVVGGYLADQWKQRDPRGRIYVCMLAPALHIPLLVLMFTRSDLNSYILISPLVYFVAGLLPSAAVTALQDFVLPRMYGTVGAIFLLGQTLFSMSLGPYLSGKIATVTGSLRLGVLSVLFAPMGALIILWIVSRRAAITESSKLSWAMEAGEPAQPIKTS